MSYKEEHPDWIAPKDFDLARLEKLGFEDMSWHNDAFPFWGDYKLGFTIGIDYTRDRSEFPSFGEHFERYHLYKRELEEGETEHECLHDDSEHVFSTNSFEELLAKLKGETTS
tara:strand:+ start:410 stop:748 length:339 start_codon:yes stop_codon:yes gene_type:complete